MSTQVQNLDPAATNAQNEQKNSSAKQNHIHNMNDKETIRDVWEDNFEEELDIIINLAEKYKIIGMDTEFPGVVYKLKEKDLGSVARVNELEYKTIKLNVDKLKVIQVGISIANEEGYLPEGITTWQFNFKFDLNKDEYASDSIDLLTNSGIKFEEHYKRGISPQYFAEYLIGSGLLFNEDIKWISFHGGFDFAYLIRMLHGKNLPDHESNFYNLLNVYFPAFYDVKYMAKEVESLKGSGLNRIAYDLNVRRFGPQHQAGSDSLLTLATYFKLKGSYLKHAPEHRHVNKLYGIGAHEEESFNDYIWNNFDHSESSPAMYGGYGMSPLHAMPMMDHYYPQPEPVYSHHFAMPYNTMYAGYGPSIYVDNGPKFKRYEIYTGKAKN